MSKMTCLFDISKCSLENQYNTDYCVVIDCNGPKKFLCNNSRCIGKMEKCDYVDNCGDNSDEESCLFPYSEYLSFTKTLFIRNLICIGS